MPLNRDAILDALCERLRDAVRSPTDRVLTVTRRDRAFDVANLPVLLVRTAGMTLDDLGQWTIEARINVLLHVPANDVSPETRLNAVIDGIAAALDARPDEMPSYGNSTTLGGVCSRCDIAGTIEVEQGIDGIGEAVIPVEIIAVEID